MAQSKQGSDYEVKVENIIAARLEKARVMICQLDFDQMEHEEGVRLHFVLDSAKNREFVGSYLEIAASKFVDLLVFPELTMPSEFVSVLLDYAKQYEMYIVGGTYYKKTDKGYVSICPIVMPDGVHYTEKINPSPFEKSSFKNSADGVIPGHWVKLFKGTKIGDFAVTICLDYTDDELRVKLKKDELDFLIITAFNGKTEQFSGSMQTDVQRSEDGLYLIYSNTLSKQWNGEGRSALYAFVDDCFKPEYKAKGCSDFIPSHKLYEFSDDKSYCIFELDLKHRKPYISKNSYTKQNVTVVEEDTAEMGKRHHFAKVIGAAENRYLFIDKYYVKPREYDEMLDLLEKEGVLVITGDPGIGKTYTAIHFLYQYFQNGFYPTWFYGLGKEDRDKQRESLMNFEPKERDVVYIEDPFGRTVFEKREELQTLFGNLVQKFRACKAKLIITSREEVFKQFENEVLNSTNLELFKKELNVRKPSYGKEDLKQIAELYLKDYTNWWDNEQFVGKVKNGIDEEKLISPLMLYNLVRNNSTINDVEILEYGIENARKTDLVTQFASEIMILSHPAKILLYLVLLYGKKNVALYREMFDKVQKNLFDKSPFDGSDFGFELRAQEGHRIQRLGVQIPVYRFSHPAYEEALINLVDSDATCNLIAKTCLSTIVKEAGFVAAEIFRRFISRYPKFLETMMKGLDVMDFAHFSEEEKLDVTRKMILSGNKTFMQTARQIYPIKKVIESLYANGNASLFELRLRALNRRKEEIENADIDWAKVFSKSRIEGVHPSQFLSCYDLAFAVEENLMSIIKANLQKTDVIRKFILLPTKNQREKFAEILANTTFNGVYQDLKDKIPDDLLNNKINKWQYARILRRYILTKEAPKGSVFVDYGAMKAMERGAKLYPIGVFDVDGNFQNGDIVNIINPVTKKKILSLAEISSSDLLCYMGLHSQEIYENTGELVNTVISRPAYREKFVLKK